MPAASSLQVPPPANWQDFESLCHALWSRIWGDPDSQKNGRSGQSQHGVDVSGRPQCGDKWVGVQCKGKDAYSHKVVTEDEVQEEVEKARHFEPPLSHFIIATTGPKDAKVEQLARTITAQHTKEDRFSVSIKGWADIVALLDGHDDLLERFCSVQTTGTRIIAEVGKRLDQLGDDVRALLQQQADEATSLEVRDRFDTRTLDGQLLQFRHNAQIAVVRFLAGMYPSATISQAPFPNDSSFVVSFSDGISLHVHVFARFFTNATDVDAMARYIEEFKGGNVMNQQLGVFVTDNNSFAHLVEYFGKFPRYGTSLAFATLGKNATIGEWHYVP